MHLNHIGESITTVVWVRSFPVPRMPPLCIEFIRFRTYLYTLDLNSLQCETCTYKHYYNSDSCV